VYLHLQLISVPPLVYLGISVPWAGIPQRGGNTEILTAC